MSAQEPKIRSVSTASPHGSSQSPRSSTKWGSLRNQVRTKENSLHHCPHQDEEEEEKLTLMDNEDSTHLLLRKYKASGRGKAEEVKELLEHDPTKVHGVDNNGWTCLHHCASKAKAPTAIPLIDILLDAGADINAQTNKKDTALNLAAAKGRVDVVRHLMIKGADPNIRNITECAPIHVATYHEHVDTIEELAKFDNVDMNLSTKRGGTALHIAAHLDLAKTASALVTSGTKLCTPCDNGIYPIHVAAKAASRSVMEILLTEGEKLGYTREFQLSFTDMESNSPLHSAVNSGDIEAVKICLEYGAIIDARQEDGATSFHLACNQGDLEIVKIMLKFHKMRNPLPDTFNPNDIVNQRDGSGQTPLHRAAKFDHADVAQFLISEGAEMECLDNQKRSPLLLAAMRGGGKSFRVLMDAGASLTVTDNTKHNIFHFFVSYGKKIDSKLVVSICQREEGKKLMNERDDEGCTPVHLATRHGNLTFLDALLGFGASINTKNNTEQSPLHFAACYGRINTVRRLMNTSNVGIINSADGMGMTALHLASMNGHTKVVRFLLQTGALIHKDYKGRTPLHWAAEKGYTQVMLQLLMYHTSLLNRTDKHKNTALHLAVAANQCSAIKFLMSSMCEYTQNEDEKYPLDICLETHITEAATALMEHDRWEEVLKVGSVQYTCPTLGLIQYLPEVYAIVLDRCQTSADMDPSSRDYWDKFNFRYMQPEARKMKEFEIKPLIGLNTMVKYGRIELLSHPVCLHYMNMKWRSYGFLFFLFNIILYGLFVGCLTGVLSTLRFDDFGRNLTHMSPNGSISTAHQINDAVCIKTRLALVFVFVFLVLNLFKEFGQIFQQGVMYFFDAVNYIEWGLYSTSMIFTAPLLFAGVMTALQWQCGAIAAFLAWFNLMMYFQRTNSMGIYVVMFLHILSTVVRVMLIFSVLIVGFGLTFHLLFNNNLLSAFTSPFISMMSALMMMMGEWNFAGVFVDPPLPLSFPSLSFFFLILFVVLMPILFINLLIGLAVGDIEMVQRNAVLKRLAMQVDYHTELEEKLPTWILEKVDKTETILYPNALCRGNKLFSLSATLRHLQNIGNPTISIHGTERKAENGLNSHLARSLEKTKNRVKAMQTQMEKQYELLQLIVQKMEISSEADQFDEGACPNKNPLIMRCFGMVDPDEIRIPDEIPPQVAMPLLSNSNNRVSRVRAKLLPLVGHKK